MFKKPFISETSASTGICCISLLMPSFPHFDISSFAHHDWQLLLQQNLIRLGLSAPLREIRLPNKETQPTLSKQQGEK